MRGKVAGMAEMKLEGMDARPEDSAFALGRVHSIETMGTVDGPGIRFVVFVQAAPCAVRIATTPIPGRLTAAPW